MDPATFKALENRVANIEKALHERLAALEKHVFGGSPAAHASVGHPKGEPKTHAPKTS